MRAIVVINPVSGGGKGLSTGTKIRNYFQDLENEITYVQGSSLTDSLNQIDSACSKSTFDLLICVGGDGLIHDLIPKLLRYQLPLLVIPSGTGNDFARTLGLYGLKIEKLLKIPIHSKPVEIDVGSISDGQRSTPFVQILSTGFDSVVNERANNMVAIKGKIKYVVAVLQKVWRFQSIEYRITIDGVLHQQRAMLVCVANGTSYGGGMMIAPHANNSDELLDIMIVDRVNPFRLLLVFPRVFLGTHVKHPSVHFFKGKNISISGDTVAFADGERISRLPISIQISKEKLLVYKA